ncbi:MAG TPA: hypothetical protein VLE96_06770 [Chlamydiales bacterium]|nr:hypothetical protein [Chlamydiales bacterium]
MKNTDSWFQFSPRLDMIARRSLALCFILEELIKEKKNYDCLSYYCENLTNEDALHKEIMNLKIAKLAGKAEQISSFFLALMPFLFQSRTDENILIKLLEIKDALNQKLGPNSIENLLSSFSPLGLTYVKTIVSEGLTRRGFTSFLAEKEHLMNTIESCPTQV